MPLPRVATGKPESPCWPLGAVAYIPGQNPRRALAARWHVMGCRSHVDKSVPLAGVVALLGSRQGSVGGLERLKLDIPWARGKVWPVSLLGSAHMATRVAAGAVLPGNRAGTQALQNTNHLNLQTSW